jgi:deoxyribonuclease IV
VGLGAMRTLTDTALYGSGVLFGGHVSGGVKAAPERAREIGAKALQLFVQSPRAWRFPEHDPDVLAGFAGRARKAHVEAVLVHAIYLVNLASPDRELYRKSTETMRRTVETACAIDADGVVFHLGSHLGAGLAAGLKRAVPALRSVLELCSERTWVLLENSAGAGGTLGRSIEELATVIDRLDRHPRLGVCLDSAHLWVSGVDVRDRGELDRVLEELDGSIGLDRLRALHVNDAASPLGSNRDRHANVGEGELGDGLGQFLVHPSFQGLPALLEVPGTDGHGPDALQVQALRDLHRRWKRRKRR